MLVRSYNSTLTRIGRLRKIAVILYVLRTSFSASIFFYKVVLQYLDIWRIKVFQQILVKIFIQDVYVINICVGFLNSKVDVKKIKLQIFVDCISVLICKSILKIIR